jgi:hypothetical protein
LPCTFEQQNDLVALQRIGAGKALEHLVEAAAFRLRV